MVNATTEIFLVVMGSIPNWVTDLGKENAEVPGSIPGAPVAWQRLACAEQWFLLGHGFRRNV